VTRGAEAARPLQGRHERLPAPRARCRHGSIDPGLELDRRLAPAEGPAAAMPLPCRPVRGRACIRRAAGGYHGPSARRMVMPVMPMARRRDGAVGGAGSDEAHERERLVQ
jgi:hypothetical protein